MFQKYGKFIVIGFLFFVTLFNAMSMLQSKENSLNICMNILVLSGFIQVLSKVYAIVTNEENLNDILEWIKALHTILICDLVKHAAENHLGRFIRLVKNISM